MHGDARDAQKSTTLIANDERCENCTEVCVTTCERNDFQSSDAQGDRFNLLQLQCSQNWRHTNFIHSARNSARNSTFGGWALRGAGAFGLDAGALGLGRADCAWGRLRSSRAAAALGGADCAGGSSSRSCGAGGSLGRAALRLCSTDCTRSGAWGRAAAHEKGGHGESGESSDRLHSNTPVFIRSACTDSF